MVESKKLELAMAELRRGERELKVKKTKNRERSHRRSWWRRAYIIDELEDLGHGRARERDRRDQEEVRKERRKVFLTGEKRKRKA